jgi:hypothetical protein
VGNLSSADQSQVPWSTSAPLLGPQYEVIADYSPQGPSLGPQFDLQADFVGAKHISTEQNITYDFPSTKSLSFVYEDQINYITTVVIQGEQISGPTVLGEDISLPTVNGEF